MSTPGDMSAETLTCALCPPAAFQTEGKLYLILDFLRGGDLFTRLSKEVLSPGGRGRPAGACARARAVCRGRVWRAVSLPETGHELHGEALRCP